MEQGIEKCCCEFEAGSDKQIKICEWHQFHLQTLIDVEKRCYDLKAAAKAMVEHLCGPGCEAVCPAIEGLRDLVKE